MHLSRHKYYSTVKVVFFSKIRETEYSNNQNSTFVIKVGQKKTLMIIGKKARQ